MFLRKAQEDQLKKVLKSQHSEFFYMRGRRRIGKSWLLKKFSKENSRNVFYFTGKLDAKNQETIKEFSRTWSEFVGNQELLEIKSSLLSWQRIFQAITQYLEKHHSITNPLVLIFDEIQWLAKEGVGFCGSLKEAWITWEQTQSIKIIVCGSSNKFFQNKTGGEETILRGLSTRSAIWLKHIPVREIHDRLCEKWNRQEVVLLFLLCGGIPYYLNQIHPELGFVHAINRAFFTKETIFLDEVNEVLRMEFNAAGIKTAKMILASLANGFTTAKKIEKNIGIAHSSLLHIMEKMIDYDIIQEKQPLFHEKSKKPEKSYEINDFYLNFFFKILMIRENAIKTNKNRLLFSDVILKSDKNYYIENFTGAQFERFVRYVLEESYLDFDESDEPDMFKKLLLVDKNYTVQTYADRSCQIDLIVKHNTDRIIRILEVKWASEQSEWIHELLKKEYPHDPSWQTRRYLVCGYPLSTAFQKKAQQHGIECLSLEDLI